MNSTADRVRPLLTDAVSSTVSLSVIDIVNKTNTTSQGIDKNFMYAIFLLNGLFAVIGFLGNIVVCVVIVRGRRMYTIANLFLMNLAIADICVLVVSYPLWVIKTFGGWPFGEEMCRILFSVSDSFYGVSLGCITTIAIHRYRMIIYSMEKQLTFFQAKVILISIWTLSLSTISAPVYPAMRYSHKTRHCGTRWPSPLYEQFYQLFLLVFWYVLPLLAILWTFVRIRYYLRAQMSYDWMSAGDQVMLTNHNAIKIGKALRMLAPVVLTFAVMMLPWNALRVSALVHVSRKTSAFGYSMYIAGTMLVANSIMNPFIYYIMSEEFKDEFRKQWWLLCATIKRIHESDMYTIQVGSSGRRYVRRLESMLEQSHHKDKNDNYRNHRTNSAASKKSQQIDFDELFKQHSPKATPQLYMSSIREISEEKLDVVEVLEEISLRETIL